MAVDVWNSCKGKNEIRMIKNTAWRIVEAQEVTATRKLVDSFEEYKILEGLIESQKPLLRVEELNIHPLLYTPFRYPPLKYGSRFGKRSEPSLWYGSLSIESVMSEKAFYQLNFLRACQINLG